MPLPLINFEIGLFLLHQIFGNYANKEIKFVGIGGVDNPKNAFIKILAGACLVQSYTGLAFRGPLLINDILDYLSVKIGNSKIENFIGTKANEIAFGEYLNENN